MRAQQMGPAAAVLHVENRKAVRVRKVEARAALVVLTQGSRVGRRFVVNEYAS